MTDKEFFSKLWDDSPMGRSGCCSPIAIAVFIGVLFLLCSCATRKSIEYVDREVVKYQKEVVHDTLIQHTHDSVFHTIFQNGDTVFDTKYVEKTKWRDRVIYKTDTCYKDSVRTIETKTTKIIYKTPKWCYALIVACIAFVLFSLVKLIRWVQIH